MKNFLTAIFLFSILFTIGCDDDDATAAEDASLVGTWELTSGTVVIHSTPEETNTYTPPEVSNTLVLADDGSYAETGTFEGEITSFSGTWSATGNVITFVVTSGTDNDEPETWVNNYTLSGDALTLVTEEPGDDEEDAQTITLVYARQ